MTEPVLWEQRGRVVILTLNRPEALNAMTPQLLDLLEAHLARIEQDPEVRAVVLTGSGEKAFCVGADLKARQQEFAAMEAGDPFAQRVERVFGHIESLPRPVIAAINGYCLGGGLELALTADLRIAAAEARFGFPEAKVGSMPGAGGTQRLPRLVGPARAKELMFLAEHIDAETALRLGLVNRVVPRAELMEATLELARAIGQRAPLSIQAIKAAVNRAMNVPLAEGLAFERERFAVLRTSEDRKEGIAAFLE
ncbi:MAG: enoyl-CoA hydratase/isomerase family protein, partial [Armatimonadota bacterium]|nr:enoyl-CoA hydratase/isomerase family protein [Armatimonadota bacterium]